MGSGHEAHSPVVGQTFEDLLEQFEESWRQGHATQIEQFLPPLVPGNSRRRLLEELICIDLDYRWRQAMQKQSPGPRPSLQDYLTRFPELGQLDELPAALIGSEYRIRKHWGDRPNHEDYLARFPRHGTKLARLLTEIDAELAPDIDPSSAVPLAMPVPEALGVSSNLGQPVGDVAGLLDVLRQTGVLIAEQQSELGSFQDRFTEPQALAKELMERGWLTPYQINQLFLGRGAELVLASYIVLERLGEGGTGVVFKAQQERLNRVVALKVIRRELLTDPEVVSRFYREIRLVSQLTSPHIVHAYDAGPVGATHFLTMEYLEGADLRRLVKASGPLPVAQAIDCVRQTALGLQHIHENRLVHRDIKPSNLFLCTAQAGGTIKILDLGLGRWRPAGAQPVPGAPGEGNSFTSLTPAGSVMVGTPDYLAPEQALDFHAADIRADIYSLGCTLYYLLTGRPPFPGGTLTQKLLMHQQAQAPPLEEFRADLPQGLAAVVGRMMAKRPEQRYQTPGELAALLADFGKGTRERNGVTERLPASRAADTGQRKRHSWRPVILGSGILLLALVVFGYLLVSGWQTPRVAETTSAVMLPTPPAKSKPLSIWTQTSETPSEAADSDPKPVELGVKFRSDVDGQIVGVRFYKTPKNTGPHSGSLWTRDGRRLASATFTNESASGWQQVDFTRPVAILANTTYVASYHCESRFYAHNRSYFERAGVKNGPLQTLANNVDGPNGVFKYNAISSFPDGSYDASNYWVDVVFTPRP
jgi:serine/threonine-protein kinase